MEEPTVAFDTPNLVPPSGKKDELVEDDNMQILSILEIDQLIPQPPPNKSSTTPNKDKCAQHK